MADPTSLDSALYRMKAYAKLLIDDPERNGIGMDLAMLCGWIENARPFLGDISIDPAPQDLYSARKKAPDTVEPTQEKPAA